MSDFIIVNARIVTMAGVNSPRRNAAMSDLGIIEHGFLHISDGKISAVESGNPSDDYISEHGTVPVVDASGRVVMPAFVDCHTHSCWAGSRLDEFELGLKGVPYLEILEQQQEEFR